MNAFVAPYGINPGTARFAEMDPTKTSSTGPSEVRSLGRSARVRSHGKIALRRRVERSVLSGIASILCDA